MRFLFSFLDRECRTRAAFLVLVLVLFLSQVLVQVLERNRRKVEFYVLVLPYLRILMVKTAVYLSMETPSFLFWL